MITINNVKTLDGQTTQIILPSSKELILDAENLLMLPGIIDPHISCGSPHHDHWVTTLESAIRGGITNLLDIPNEATTLLEQKRLLVDKRLFDLEIPLQYYFYGKGNSKNLDVINLEKKFMLGSIILLNSDHEELDETQWNRIFQLAAWEDFPIVINSKKENSWKRVKNFNESFLEKAIYYAEKQNTRLYVLNVATQSEVDLIEAGRTKSLLIYAETTPEYLFPRDPSRADCLWEAINKGVIETIGSGYSIEEPYPERLLYKGKDLNFLNPCFLLPFLLNAVQEGKITLENVVKVTRVNFHDIFKIERNSDDIILVDLEKMETIQRKHLDNLTEFNLKGWPVYTIVKGQIFKVDEHGNHLERIE